MSTDLLHVSPNQINTLMNNLNDCLLQKNSYGSDVCEIYIYSMMEHSPTFANNPDSQFCADAVERAKRNIVALCKNFAQNNEVIVTFEDGTPLSVKLIDSHRVHLRVLSKKGMKKS
ncbi:MAG: hypothetical protein ABWX90_02515 [Candidatus Saccharimonadales bacterium]